MAEKISVIIPNYNGQKLLEKNIPEVIKNCPESEIIIVDDASTDDSVKLVKNKFKKVKLIVQKQNKGFGATVNNGVKSAHGDLVLLLNSDIMPLSGFLQPLLKHFKNNRDLFAAGIADNSYENDKGIVIRGRGGAKFEKGFFLHYPMPIKKGKTLWVSGGSGLFSKAKFEALGGFDTDYAPFYWEDIDLSFRAWKAGYQCIFEPNSKVNHFHELGAIKINKNEFFIKTVSYKNQFIFVWKNIDDPIYILGHIAYLPYHLTNAAIKRNWAFILGFFKAILQIPNLILHYHQHPTPKIKEDREILNEFKKP